MQSAIQKQAQKQTDLQSRIRILTQEQLEQQTKTFANCHVRNKNT